MPNIRHCRPGVGIKRAFASVSMFLQPHQTLKLNDSNPMKSLIFYFGDHACVGFCNVVRHSANVAHVRRWQCRPQALFLLRGRHGKYDQICYGVAASRWKKGEERMSVTPVMLARGSNHPECLHRAYNSSKPMRLRRGARYVPSRT
jgi:hypothetical protein